MFWNAKINLTNTGTLLTIRLHVIKIVIFTRQHVRLIHEDEEEEADDE